MPKNTNFAGLPDQTRDELKKAKKKAKKNKEEDVKPLKQIQAVSI